MYKTGYISNVCLTHIRLVLNGVKHTNMKENLILIMAIYDPRISRIEKILGPANAGGLGRR